MIVNPCTKFCCDRSTNSEDKYSLQNPKKFRTCEPFKFSNVRFFYPYEQQKIFVHDLLSSDSVTNLQRKNFGFSETVTGGGGGGGFPKRKHVKQAQSN